MPFENATIDVAILILPGFLTNELGCVVEPFRVANRIADTEIYRWQVIAPDAETVSSLSGVRVQGDPLENYAITPDYIFVLGGSPERNSISVTVRSWLRQMRRQKCRICAVSDGVFALAHLGFCEDQRVTAHWDSVDVLSELFPAVDLMNGLYHTSDRFSTSCGGMATLDLVLAMIGEHHTPLFVNQIADALVVEHVRDRNSIQRTQLDRMDIRVASAIKIMEENIARHLSTDEIARGINLSSRQMQRLFVRFIGMSPRKYLTELRLKKAHRILERTQIPITEIALACGFETPSHFAWSFKRVHKLSPSNFRKLRREGGEPKITQVSTKSRHRWRAGLEGRDIRPVQEPLVA